MIVDEQLLLAYVDGELASEHRSGVEAAIAHSPELAAQAEALRASRLPYQSAFNQQNLPPVPSALTNRIAELVSVSTGTNQAARADKPRMANFWRLSKVPFGLAAAFAAGIVFHVSLASMNMGAPVESTQWVKAVATYQDLYVRDTVANVDADPLSTQKLLTDIRERDGMPLQIPDLRSAGLEFKRIQRLAFNRHALIQMVYLPQHGDPIALCILDATTGDSRLKEAQVGEMRTVSWEKNGLAYILLGKGNTLELQKIGQQLQQGSVPVLMG